MVELIAGNKGKGKTKLLLEKVSAAVLTATGNIVYLDKNQQHIHELTNKVRLINVSDYPVSNCDEFIGFICGIISQDYDLQEMYLDSFLTIAHLKDDEVEHTILKLDEIGKNYNIKFVISISKDEKDLPDSVKDMLIVSL